MLSLGCSVLMIDDLHVSFEVSEFRTLTDSFVYFRFRCSNVQIWNVRKVWSIWSNPRRMPTILLPVWFAYNWQPLLPATRELKDTRSAILSSPLDGSLRCNRVWWKRRAGCLHSLARAQSNHSYHFALAKRLDS